MTATEQAAGAVPGGPAVRRSRWKRVLLVLGVLGLLLALALALAPGMLSGWVARRVEADFAAGYHGRVEVGELALAWTGRQSARGVVLFDPSGARVAELSAELPSLLDLLRGGGQDLGEIELEFSADLVVADDGSSNLQSALAARDEGKQGEARSETGSSGEADSGLEGLQARLHLKPSRVTYSDSFTRAASAPVTIEGLEAWVLVHGDSAAPSFGPLRPTPSARSGAMMTVSGTLSGQGSSPLKAELQVEDPFGQRPKATLDASVDGLPSGLLDALAGLDGLLIEAFGPTFSVHSKGQGWLEQADLAFELSSPRTQITAGVRLRDGRLQNGEGPLLDVELEVGPALAEKLSTRFAPAGLALLPEGAGTRLKITLEEASLPLQEILESDDPLAAALASGTFRTSGRLGGWRVSDESLRAAGLELTGRELGLAASLTPSDGRPALRIELTGALGLGDRPGPLRLVCSAPDARELSGFAPGGTLAPITLELDLERLALGPVDRWLALEGRLSEGLGPELGLSLRTRLAFDVGKLMTDGEATLSARDRKSRVVFRAAVDDALAERDPGTLPPLEAELELTGVDLLARFLPPDLQAQALELLGDSLTAKLTDRPDGTGGASRLALELTAARVEVRAGGVLADGVLRASGEERIEARLQPTASLVTAYLEPSLPVGASFTLVDGPITLSLSELELPLEAFLGEAPPVVEGSEAEASNEALAALLDGARAVIDLRLPGATYTHPALEGASAVPVVLEDLRVDARLAGAAGLTAKVTGRVRGARAGELFLDLAVTQPGSFLRPGEPTGRVTVDGRAAALPTALIDGIAGQDGLLVDVLGPEIDGTLRGTWPGKETPIRAELRSANASAVIEATLEEGVLIAGDAKAIEASLPLTPLFNRRIVGALVPLLVDLEKPPEARPVGLELGSFRLPLDGDLTKLDGTLRLDLGEVAYQLLPGLDSALKFAGVQQVGKRLAKLEPIAIRIDSGVAHYEGLPLVVEGQTLLFKGSYDLTSTAFDLTVDVPLKLLGGSLEQELKEVSKLLGPDLAVPLRLAGTWKRPRVSIGKGFVEDALKDAGKRALGEGLRDLFKKKKDD